MFQGIDLLTNRNWLCFMNWLCKNSSEIIEYLLGSQDKNAEHQVAQDLQMAFDADKICAAVVFHFRVGTFHSAADMIANRESANAWEKVASDGSLDEYPQPHSRRQLVFVLKLSMSTLVVGKLNSAFSRNALKNVSRSSFFRPTPHHFISDVMKRSGRIISTVLRKFTNFPVIFTPNSPSSSWNKSDSMLM